MNNELSKSKNFFNIQKFFKKILFIISVPTVTLLLSNTGSGKQRLLSVILSFIIAIFVTFKFNILDKIFKENNKIYSIISAIFAVITSLFFGQLFYSYNIVVEPVRSIFINILPDSLTMYSFIILSLYALYSFYYFFISRFLPKAKEFFKK